MRHGADLVLQLFGPHMDLPAGSMEGILDSIFPPTALDVVVDFERYGEDRIEQRGLLI